MKKLPGGRELVLMALLFPCCCQMALAQLSFDLDKSFFLEVPADTAGVFAGQKGPFGGISAITYSGTGDYYYLLSDGLPARYYTFSINMDAGLELRYIDVHYLKEKDIRGEGMAIASRLRFISDERSIDHMEATRVWAMDETGQLSQLNSLPAKYYGEMYDNSGFEGLALSPDGTTLFAAMERALPASSCRSVLPILQCATDRPACITHYYPMQWESKGNGISALLALGNHELLVVERDYLPAENRNEVSIFRVALARGSSDNEPDCPAESHALLVPELVFSFGRQLTLGGRSYKVNNIEGATFSADGNYLLLVSDNNFGNKGKNTPTQLVALRLKARRTSG